MWAPVYVEHRSCVTTYCRVGFVNSTSLVQRKHKKCSSPTCFYDYGNKSGIDSAKGTIPGHSRNPDVIITLVILHRLSKYVPKLALPYHSPHCVRAEVPEAPPPPPKSPLQSPAMLPTAVASRLALRASRGRGAGSRPRPRRRTQAPPPRRATPNQNLWAAARHAHFRQGKPASHPVFHASPRWSRRGMQAGRGGRRCSDARTAH